MEDAPRTPNQMVGQAQEAMVDFAEEARLMTQEGNRRRKPIAVVLVSLALVGLAGLIVAQVIRRRRRIDDDSLEAELERIRDGQRQLEEELDARARRSNVSA